MSELTQDKYGEEKETFMSKSSQLVLQISGAALFGALSLVLSIFVTPTIPRIPGWGIAIIDPVSIVWVICFLIFGPKAGILCCIIGTFGLMPFDPFTPIGPIMKFSATFALIIIPILFLKLFKTEQGAMNIKKIKNLRNFTIYGLFGIILRIIIMMLFNYFLFITLFADSLSFVNLEFLGFPSISGWTAVILGVIIINAETSIWDLFIPYLIVFGSKLDRKFELW